MDFSKQEEKIQKYWESIKAFELSNKLSKGKKEFSFYDGPPFATGLPHYGHILSGTIKDTVTRFYYQQDYHVERRFGWDCHGLPIEYEIDKIYNIKTKQDIEKIGVKKYNEYCREIVMRYSGQWEAIVGRMGRWIDFKNDYKTMDFSFMESVWWVFKELYKKGMVYRGYRVMPYSTACRTPMSNFEANQNYKVTTDLTATIRLPVLGEMTINGTVYSNVSFLAWTTTPWTLPGNSALMVNPEMEYVLLKDKVEGAYVIAGKFYAKKAAPVEVFAGKSIVGVEYTQPFAYFEGRRSSGYFRTYAAEFVVEGAGTGIVHCAPGFGEEDYTAFVANGIIKENDEVVCPVDESGRYTEEVLDYAGRYVKEKELEKEIIRYLKEKGVLYETTSIDHSYPFCWRSDTPLIYKAVPSWFVHVKSAVADLIKMNKTINWSPKSVGEGKFGLWLENARDWSISRNRYWGTPIPIWIREGAGANLTEDDIICIGSVEELYEHTGIRTADLHKDIVDTIVIEKGGVKYIRTEEVLDCWFESGSMPYAQKHFPFENEKRFQMTFPADFIAEGLDQTRGWFYTLHVLSVLLYNSAAFKNVMVTGLVLAADGKKMSKRLKNYPDPMEIMNTHGADAMRMYLISSTAVKAENLKFTEAGVVSIVRELLIPWQNCLRFLKTTSSAAKEDSTGCDVEDIALSVSSLDIKIDEGDSMLDLWILQEFKEFSLAIQSEGLEYRLHNILPKTIEFLGDLSRWYIRLSRDRLRNTEMKVLRHILKGLSVIMAPFTPFFSEVCYQEIAACNGDLHKSEPSEGGNISEQRLSVHFQMYKEQIERTTEKILKVSKMSKITSLEKILTDFRKMKSVIETVRVIREKCEIALKMPLKEISIVGMEMSSVLTSIIEKESNSLVVSYKTESDYAWKKEILPDFKKISALYGGGEVQKRTAAIRKRAADQEAITKLLTEGALLCDGINITRDEVIYKREALNLPVTLKGASASDLIYVVIDTERSEEIEIHWVKREVKSLVQKLRKKAGLHISDKALLHASGVDSSDVICDANTYITSDEPENAVSETLNLAGRKIVLSLAKEP
ncbi:isoleucyl-tRNA synthetase [Nematocida ausubeli]|uniref:Probable isoleucine--tRNA ligase, cytoplasmic n=1 Tax=Nematocida ausubeli (strain ATCC PRA-371 / ERTm2) TaxID=1913371 RepID=A0A086J2U7_NEMA1|nr:isoleucyl-tRNA synthetase [Nematocida ausubeli]KFG26465.1 isoleucyl-tRNA synthetase [Nematocida ausubeli]